MHYDINCEHPVLILNREFVRLLPKFGCVHYPDHIHEYPFRVRLELKFPFVDFYSHKDEVSPENVDQYYAFHPVTGETVPMWQYVPCGHCVLCRDRKTLDLVARASYETQLYSIPPMFVTLTYDNLHLPENGVNKRDCQLFFKRLRRNFEYHGLSSGLRYYCVSEYGKKHLRPHYHLILWNPPINNQFAMKAYIYNAWQNGMVYVENCKGNYAGYCMKYVKKIGPQPSDKAQTFVLSSRGHGGIGAQFILRHKEFFYKHNQIYMPYLDRFQNKLCKLYCVRYVKDKIFPTISKFFKPKEFKALRTVTEDGQIFDGSNRWRLQFPYFYKKKYYTNYECKILNTEECKKTYLEAVSLISAIPIDKFRQWQVAKQRLQKYRAMLVEYFRDHPSVIDIASKVFTKTSEFSKLDLCCVDFQ